MLRRALYRDSGLRRAQCHRPASGQLLVTARASTAARENVKSSSSAADSDALAKRASALQDLVEETVKISISTGPRGIGRALQAASALASIARETLERGQPEAPQVILRKLFERLGATYIKLGQFIASSPSLFPDEYVVEFQKLLDKTEPVSYQTIERIIEAELQQPWRNVFSFIDPQPLATASIAQVHAAVHKASGKQVVLKVLKPGVEDVLVADMNFVYIFSRVLEFFQPDLARLSLAGVLSDIRTSMLQEVDFECEARHIQHFATFLDTRGFRNTATCPFVYKQLTTKRLLVLERLQGVPLTDYNAIRAVTSRDPETVLVGALNTWFASVLGAETFHADVHAGNLLVLPDGRVAFIDFGIVSSISPVTWKAVEALVGSIALQDYETMARALATIGAADEAVDDYQAFARDLEAFFTELEVLNAQANIVVARPEIGVGAAGPSLSATLEVDQAQVNRLLLQLVRIGENHGVRFPREFGLFIKQLLYFDRYTRILAPQLQVFADERINVRNLSRTYGA